jgi:hypothetical protein
VGGFSEQLKPLCCWDAPGVCVAHDDSLGPRPGDDGTIAVPRTVIDRVAGPMFSFSRFFFRTPDSPARSGSKRRRRFAMTVVTTAIAVVLAVWQTDVVHVVHRDMIRNTVGFAPEQFYQALDLGDRAEASNSLLTIAHNAGDRKSTTQMAIGYGADVIEVDVIAIGDHLYASHDIPNERISSVTFRGPSLASIWSTATDHARIELDLKEYSPHYLNLLVGFLDERGGGEGVIISSRSPGAIATLRTALPDATLVYSIGDRASLASLQGSESLVDEIDGVSIRTSLLDEDTVTWLKDHNLLVYAWTVNDFASAEWLVELGVDGIATDNLALIEHYGERPLVEDS